MEIFTLNFSCRRLAVSHFFCLLLLDSHKLQTSDICILVRLLMQCIYILCHFSYWFQTFLYKIVQIVKQFEQYKNIKHFRKCQLSTTYLSPEEVSTVNGFDKIDGQEEGPGQNWVIFIWAVDNQKKADLCILLDQKKQARNCNHLGVLLQQSLVYNVYINGSCILFHKRNL